MRISIVHKLIAMTSGVVVLGVAAAYGGHASPSEQPGHASSSEQPRHALSREFDDIFREECHPIPLAYLRALAKSESNFNPREANGAAWGLLQVVEVVRRGYNQRHSTAFTRQDLLDPRINARVACSLLKRITRRFVFYHRKSFPRPRWRNLRFVRLVTFAWNAGHSRRAGVSYVLASLEQRGESASQITLDRVHQSARYLPGVSRHLRNAAKVRWCKGVVYRYSRELRLTAGDG